MPNWKKIITSGSDATLNSLETYYINTVSDNSFKKSLSSGIITGGLVSINADPTKIDISAGEGIIIDSWTNPSSSYYYHISWSNLVGQPVTYLTSSTLSFIGINNSGSLVQYPTRETNSQRRDLIMLAQLAHTGKTQINNISSIYTVMQSPISQFRDLLQEFKFISDGLTISPSGSTLYINRSSGYLFGEGINYDNNIKDPHKKFFSSSISLNIVYRTQVGSGSTSSTIDPTKYDLNGTITTIAGSSNQATNQRVYISPSGNTIIQYGQQVYSTLVDAIAGVQNEPFVAFANVDQVNTLIGIISVQKGCTDLSNTSQARFLRTSKFGEVVGSAAGVSVTSLQKAYDNSLTPEIVTNSTLGAVSIKRGSGADTDNILEIVNGSDVTTAYITGTGKILGTQLITSGGNASQYLKGDGSLGYNPFISAMAGM